MQQPTNEDEREANAEGQDVTTERLVVLPITLCKNAQPWIDVVLTQSLESQEILFIHFICEVDHLLSQLFRDRERSDITALALG